MKILLLSTPKTGNTWTEALLAAIYDLPVVQLGARWDGATYHFDRGAADALGARWIAHHHLASEPEIIRWADAHRVALVTTVRHPADTLVSLYHYARNYADSGMFPKILPFVTSTSDMYDADPRKAADARREVTAYLRDGFAEQIDISMSWIRSRRSRAIRYEDLWRDPVQAVATLTSRIVSVPADAIERAVDQCEIGLMRRTAGDNGKFFRRGGAGAWRTELPSEIVEILRHQAPYPAQFAELGYRLDPDDPSYDVAPKPRASRNPFRAATHFDNGVPVSPFIVRCYLTVDSAFSGRWLPPTSSAPDDSFYGWLNAPAERDPHRGRDLPMITNLAEYLYRIRRDLSPIFPDPFGRDRVGYVQWFIRQAPIEHAIAPAFIRPTRESLVGWAMMLSDDDQRGDGADPALTNFSLSLYRDSPDIQGAFPDVFGPDRVAYLTWLCRHAPLEGAFDDESARRLREELGRMLEDRPPQRGDTPPTMAAESRDNRSPSRRPR